MVYANGHRAEVRYRGYEALEPGRQFVLFLFWSPDYEAYVLAGGLSGVIRVNDDLSLSPLASSEEIRSHLCGMDLDGLITRVGAR